MQQRKIRINRNKSDPLKAAYDSGYLAGHEKGLSEAHHKVRKLDRTIKDKKDRIKTLTELVKGQKEIIDNLYQRIRDNNIENLPIEHELITIKYRTVSGQNSTHRVTNNNTKISMKSIPTHIVGVACNMLEDLKYKKETGDNP